MMQFTEKELASTISVLRSNEFDEEQKAYFKARVISRLKYLCPLVEELHSKGYFLNEISNDLNNEYNDLIFMRNKFIV
tara:strand:- start:153 stop:386 length:234 start_codon:yes stop_codon:yes gene_type:complete